MSTVFVTGSVKWFSSDKGYGFIIHEGRDIFLHSKRLRESGFGKDSAIINFTPGEKLKFRILSGPKGDYAVDISKA
jgi:CspA family cold shock protein